mgnify:CR=1 FL=1
MSQRYFRLTALSLAATLALAGCSLAPRYERPAAPVPAQYPDQLQPDAAKSATSVAVTADLGWREFFRDPRLLALIELSLKNNRDMRIAVERVQEARAQFGIQQSDRLPTIGIGANGQVQHTPENMRSSSDAPAVSRSYQAGIGTTSFELDFFGRVKSLTEAAYQQYLSTEQAQRTVHISLVAQVAEAYFSLRTAQLQQELVQKTLKSRQASYDLVKQRYDLGVAGALDLYQAKTQVDTARADLQSARRAQAQAGNALQLLVGEPLPADLPAGAPFGKDQLVASVPAGLPSELLTRRPDIMGAEHDLMGANANIGAARAAFFPNISITGLLGFASPALGGLFTGDQRFWSFTPQLTMPIFSGGVSGNLDLAKARKNIAVAQYEKTIQTAFREVADALAGEATYTAQLDALRSLEDASLKSLEVAQMRYDNGIDSFLQVQTSEISLYTAQQQFLQAGLNSLSNRVELYKALGGGWLENSAQASAAPAPGQGG